MSSFQFRTPAAIQDFQEDASKQQQLNSLWNDNLNGFTQQAMLGNPWNATNVPAATNYYNPIDTNPASSVVPIVWPAFPGRIAFNYPNLSTAQISELADSGAMPNDISNNPCGTNGSPVPYFPYGPRGWQDEYCEWAVTRNTAGKITRIDFTCENPEYWNSLWLIDPNKVLSLYQQILNKPQIILEDLSLPGVKDPVSGNPVYNPLNKWNSGTVSNDQLGGAIHLTSTPNTLQTEIGLASSATVLRIVPNSNPQSLNWSSSQYNDLLCDAQYGQKDRNSDPTIGGNVNNLVQINNVSATLADPPGLYIQLPDFSNYVTPDGTDASTFWNIVRGTASLQEQGGTALPGNFILHAVFEVPEEKGYTVGDITISGQNILWGSDVANTFKMHIIASAYSVTTPQVGYQPVGTPAVSYAQPLQLFYSNYFSYMINAMIANPVDHAIPLLSNSTYVPARIKRGSTNIDMVVICDTCTAKANDRSTYPTVSFSDPNITAKVTAVQNNVYYAVPGNSKPSYYTALLINLQVGVNASQGFPDLFVTNVGQQPTTGMPALLSVL